MNRLLSILVFLFLVLSGHAQQTYNDALIFDAKGDVACIEYISQEDGNTSNMSINFNRDGSLENIVFSVETEDGFAFKQTQKIEEIQRDEFEQPIAITFKSFVLSKFVVNITWINNVAKEFQYNLVYNTKYVKEVGDDGLTAQLKFYVIGDDSQEAQYAGEKCFKDYTFDDSGNWLKRTVTLIDENGEESKPEIEERHISYY